MTSFGCNQLPHTILKNPSSAVIRVVVIVFCVTAAVIRTACWIGDRWRRHGPLWSRGQEALQQHVQVNTSIIQTFLLSVATPEHIRDKQSLEHTPLLHFSFRIGLLTDYNMNLENTKSFAEANPSNCQNFKLIIATYQQR